MPKISLVVMILSVRPMVNEAKLYIGKMAICGSVISKSSPIAGLKEKRWKNLKKI